MTSHANGRAAAAVQVRSLTKTFPGGIEAVKGISFDVAAGEVFGLLGPNGAGKSTTIGMLTTTIVPTSGTALLVGHDVVKRPLHARSVSSVVFQEAVVDRAPHRPREHRAPRAALGHRPTGGRDAHRRARRCAGRRGHPRPCGQQLQRRPAAAARDRAGARVPAPRPLPGRAHRRPGPADPARAARHPRRAAPARGDDDRADDALPRGGRAPLRPRRDRPRRRDRRARHALGAARRPR